MFRLLQQGSIATANTHRLLPRSRLFSSSRRTLAEVELFVDGKPVKIEQGTALIQACEKAGATIPRFCYHERLSVAGNCRMCLVEVEKVPKPVASCAWPVAAGMKVYTNTPLVHKAREGVMEFLLSNHPLDCPICDQGGECDLQDQSIRYGSDRGRFREFEGKRAVEDKDFGPLIKTTMTRCIHCTRCVRFANEVAGAEELGTSGRGNDMQIGMYIEKTLDSEMSANIIDLCPVGALTSKPYEFKSRPWELKKTDSIDVMDAIGSNIRVDSRGLEVLRVQPRLNEEINEEWISDKTRFACDGLKRQRLTSPMIKVDGEFVPATWREALQKVAQELKNVKGAEITAVAGQMADAESLVALKDFFTRLGSENFHLDGKFVGKTPAHGVDIRSNYVMNSRISGPEEADVLLLVGAYPKKEGPILNARIRKSWLHNGLNIGLVGEAADLSYEYDHVGVDVSSLDELVTGKHPFFEKLSKSKKPMIVIGSGIAEHADAARVFSQLGKLTKKVPGLLTKDWNGINVLQRNAAQCAALDVGFVPTPATRDLNNSKVVYLLEADQLSEGSLPSDAFVVYQGHHGDVGANLADIILPGCAYTEKSATYVNTEGRAQMTRAAVSPPGSAREDWSIIRALSEMTGTTLPYDEVYTLRERMSEIAPNLTRYGVVEETNVSGLGLAAMEMLGDKKKTSGKPAGPFTEVVSDFYLTDSISRSSPTMAKCSLSYTRPKLEQKKATA